MLEDEPDIVAPVVANMVESLRARLQAAERVIRQARLKVQGDMAREDILPILDTPLPALPGLMAPPTKLQAPDPGAHGGPIPRYAMHDVWTALRGLPYFDSWYNQRGYALAWADLMEAIRGVRAAQNYIDLLAVDLLAIDPEALEKVIAKAMLDSWSDATEHADSPLAIARAVIKYLGAQEAAEGEWEHAVRDPAGRILFMPTAVPVVDGDVAVKRRPAGPWIEETS